MPIYEYKCRTCGREFEELVPSSSSQAPKCPGCSGDDVNKKMSVFGSSGSGSGSGSCGGHSGFT